MKEVFLKILSWANITGRITEALMYESGEYATVKCETNDAIYKISICKDKKTNGNDGN